MTDKEKQAQTGITIRAFTLGVLLSAYFAWATVIRENKPPHSLLSVHYLPVMPYVGLFFLSLVINPLLRVTKLIRALTKGEMLLIFVMCAVTSGVATFGLVAPMVPIVSGLNNRDNNNEQSQWGRYVMPYLNENYFIAVEGTRAAAIRYRDAARAHDNAKRLQRAAKSIINSRQELERIAIEKKRIAEIKDPELRTAEERTLIWPEQQAKRLLEMSTEIYESLGEGQDPAVIASSYDEKVAKLKKERDRLREELYELNEAAFDAVDLVRNGFPEGRRAIPGFLYSPGEGWAGYRARIKRLRVGTEARDHLRAVADKLKTAEGSTKPDPDALADEIQTVAEQLAPLERIPEMEARKERLAGQAEKKETRLQKLRKEVRELRHQRRYASQEDFPVYDGKISELDETIAELEKDAKALREEVENEILPALKICERVRGSQETLRAIATQLRAARPSDYSSIRRMLLDQVKVFRSFDASYDRFFFGDVEWSLWVRPLLNWLVLVFLMYAVLMSFNTLIYRQWSHNEKLIYPIAEATTVLAAGGAPNAEGYSIYKSGLFWTGFILATGILGWNRLAQTGTIPNVSPIQLETLWLSYVGNSVFRGMGSTYFCIIFAVIGISFLVPSNISLSLWGTELAYMVMLMVMAWLGYGGNRWQIGNASRSFLGSGAVWVFGISILWTCRNYIFCLFKPSSIDKLSDAEKKELRTSSALFLGGSLLLIVLLVLRLDTPIYRAIKWFLTGIILTIAVVRAVCEAGVLAMEGGLRAFPLGSGGSELGMQVGAASAPAVHLAIFGRFALGMKGFIAPIMANILKIREDIPGRRLHFHLAVWVGLVVAVFIALVSLIILSYDKGANSLFGWTNSAIPKWTFNGIKNMVANPSAPPVDMRGWWIAGAVLMIILLYSRQKFSRVPHPIGLVMLINPVMFGFWGSIMIGWLFKSLASKYCNKKQYRMIRCFFIGLIVGHLVAALLGWDRLEWHWG